MAAILADRVTAQIDGDFVVFLIGMRLNKPWKLWSWGPVVSAMPRMIAELERRPELGLLHARPMLGFPNLGYLQYWRSFDLLHAYATNTDSAHLPAWRDFNRRIGTNGDVGIWHETYLIKAGQMESVYVNMPPYGLGRAGTLVPAAGSSRSAKGRLKQSDGADQPG